MLHRCDLVSTLFACIAAYRAIPAVLNASLSVLRALAESDKRFGARLLRSARLFGALEELACSALAPSILPATPLRPQPASPATASTSLRLFFFESHAQSAFCSSLHVLALLEALARHSRGNASRLAASRVLPAVKQWVLALGAPSSALAASSEANAVLEGALSVWRAVVMYGEDVESVDPFFPQLLRIAQFAMPAPRSLVWSFFEASVLAKRAASSAYFVDFCNTLVQLVSELLARRRTPALVRAAAVHFVASYVETVNEAGEQWTAALPLWDSLQRQIFQLGFGLLRFEEGPADLMMDGEDEGETPSMQSETPSKQSETPSTSTCGETFNPKNETTSNLSETNSTSIHSSNHSETPIKEKETPSSPKETPSAREGGLLPAGQGLSEFDSVFALQQAVESEWRALAALPNAGLRASSHA